MKSRVVALLRGYLSAAHHRLESPSPRLPAASNRNPAFDRWLREFEARNRLEGRSKTTTG
jgi:hypothetical protein